MRSFLIKHTGNKKGHGLFANKNFKKGDFIFQFKGRHVGWRKSTNRSLQISNHEWIIPFANNPGSWINHSCDPNCGIKDLNKIVAMRFIKKGDEITFDYSTNVGEKSWRMHCHCHTKQCRKIIRPYKFLPHILKKKYKSWTSSFLLKEI